MAKETGVKIDNLQELLQCCDDTLDSLVQFHQRLTKIIAVKKNLSIGASDHVAFNQAQDITGAITNLEKINGKLIDAIATMNQLSQQALVLSRQFNLIVRS